MLPALDVRMLRPGPVAVIATAGEIDASNSTEFRERVEDALRGLEVHVVLDLSEVAFIDSAGLSALVRLLRATNRGRHQLALVYGPGAVQRALSATGLEHSFAVHPSVDAAEEALRAAPRIGR